jgi:hypothetical protein
MASFTLVLGTRNEKKKKELVQLLGPHGFTLLTLADFPQALDVEESGQTFADNATAKPSRKQNTFGNGCSVRIAVCLWTRYPERRAFIRHDSPGSKRATNRTTICCSSDWPACRWKSGRPITLATSRSPILRVASAWISRTTARVGFAWKGRGAADLDTIRYSKFPNTI